MIDVPRELYQSEAISQEGAKHRKEAVLQIGP